MNLIQRSRFLLGLLVAACTSHAFGAEERQDLQLISEAAARFVKAQVALLPGEVQFTLGKIDARLALPPCAALEPYLPAGSRLWGSTAVGVRCLGTTPWSVSIPVQVKVRGQVLVAARPLVAGQTLAPGDLVTRDADLTTLPAGLASDPLAVQGKTLAFGLAAQQPLRLDWLRAAQVIQQGQAVKIVAQGRGFRLTNEGTAVANALEGQVAQARLASGQTVKGVARSPGLIEVIF